MKNLNIPNGPINGAIIGENHTQIQLFEFFDNQNITTTDIYNYCKSKSKRVNGVEFDFDKLKNKIDDIFDNEENKSPEKHATVLLLTYLIQLINNILYFDYFDHKPTYEKAQIEFFKNLSKVSLLAFEYNIIINDYFDLLARDFLRYFIPFYWSIYQGESFFPEVSYCELFLHCDTILSYFDIEDTKQYLINYIEDNEFAFSKEFEHWGRKEFLIYLKSL